MKTRLRVTILCLILAAIHAPLFAAATLTLQFQNSGVLSIPNPFQASFDPDSPYYSILSNSALAQPTQGYGTYTDSVGQHFTVLNPIPSQEPILNLNLGNYVFNPGVPLNTEITGVTVSLFYTLYSVDPNSPSFDPIADYVSNDEVSISNLTLEDRQGNSGPPLQAVAPEPESWALAAAGLLLVGFALLRKYA